MAPAGDMTHLGIVDLVHQLRDVGCYCDPMGRYQCPIHPFLEEVLRRLTEGVHPVAWRRMGWEDLAQLQQWVKEGVERRWRVGEERYHSNVLGFQGQPMAHLVEELMDALVYLFAEMRRQGHV